MRNGMAAARRLAPLLVSTCLLLLLHQTLLVTSLAPTTGDLANNPQTSHSTNAHIQHTIQPNDNSNDSAPPTIDHQSRSSPPPYPHCTLGDDTFQIGERWNPNLPPFGVQVCVQCECTIRQRKLCYETKVTCRRITNECPIIDSCPDGSKPITVVGQCCKTCQSTAGSWGTQSAPQPEGHHQQSTPPPPPPPPPASASLGLPELHHLSTRSLAPAKAQPPAELPSTTPPASHLTSTTSTTLTSSSESTITATSPTDAPPTTSMTLTTITPPVTTTAAPYRQPSLGLHPVASFKAIYMNERTKDYLSMVKNLPACPSRDGGKHSSGGQPVGNIATTISTGPKATKSSNRNDLNGIDTRLAFKSLHDVVPSYSSAPTKSRANSTGQRGQLEGGSRQPNNDDPLRLDQQHPNDVQSAMSVGASQFAHNSQTIHSFGGSVGKPNNGPGRPQSAPPPGPREPFNAGQVSPSACTLGNETFQIGDIWNPILPPFGVQVCVHCSCIFRVRRSCFEPRVVCRRINKDCPTIDICPDGKPPVTVAGQCCKSCPLASDLQTPEVIPNVGSGNSGLQAIPNESNSFDGLQRNEKIFREFQTISKSLPTCARRDNVDNSTSNRYSNTKRTKRSQ